MKEFCDFFEVWINCEEILMFENLKIFLINKKGAVQKVQFYI